MLVLLIVQLQSIPVKPDTSSSQDIAELTNEHALVVASECVLEAANKLACFYRKYSMISDLVNNTCLCCNVGSISHTDTTVTFTNVLVPVLTIILISAIFILVVIIIAFRCRIARWALINTACVCVCVLHELNFVKLEFVVTLKW